MGAQALFDQNVFPTPEVLSSVLGASYSAYLGLMDMLRAAQPDAVVNWKYYRDARSWLLNAAAKKKTLFWLAAENGCFRTTFYLGAEFEEAVSASALPPETKERYAASSGKKFRGVTVRVERAEDLRHFAALLDWKRSR